MCTSIAFSSGSFYFGRNLDLECGFGERVVLTPRHFPLKFRLWGELHSHLALIGMANVTDDYPLYAEAANEKGLCMAALNFPDNAYYTPASGNTAVSPFELIPWVLSQCEDIKQAEQLLRRTEIADLPFSDAVPLTPLHWHVADKSGSLTVEYTRSGASIVNNTAGVLTNSPPFDFHMANLSQYLNVTPQEPANRFLYTTGAKLTGNGLGTVGLPGGLSSASRFVRAVFLREYSVCEEDEMSSVAQFFHILDNVAMPEGSVRTPKGFERTRYSSCISAQQGVFYYKTYSNSRISAVSMFNEDLDSEELIEFPLVLEQDILHIN